MSKNKKKEKDFFTGSVWDHEGDVITHQSMRKFKRGTAQKAAERNKRAMHHLQYETDKEGNEKIIYHDPESFREHRRKRTRQVDRAHRPFNAEKYERNAEGFIQKKAS
jgi:hypothetical protein